MEEFDPKQPSEAYYLGFDFTKDLGDDDVASATFVILDTNDDDEDVTTTLSDSTKQANEGKIAYLWIRAGTDGHKYKITCVAVSDGDPAATFELEGHLKVKAI